MRSLSWIIWWFLNASTSVLVRGRPREITDRWREGNPRAEIGALQPQAQESRLVGKSEKRILPGASGGGQVCPHLDFGLSVHIKSLGLVRLFATLWTVAHQVLLSIGFSRHEYWNGLHAMPSSKGSSWPRNWTCVSLMFPALAGGFFTTWFQISSLQIVRE